ncbi:MULTISPECIES: hypothetical protein [Burkholderiaceae]|uniref:hypothetical protein n=1 Tax=Burkholderiaceae TaxID=119060 RepID=UPI001F189B98|nr:MULTISPECIES: hypothetical protein [Burkholderiaceae]
MSSNSYVNLKIATCLVRYADDRLIDQRFPRYDPHDLLAVPVDPVSRVLAFLQREEREFERMQILARLPRGRELLALEKLELLGIEFYVVRRGCLCSRSVAQDDDAADVRELFPRETPVPRNWPSQ